MPENPEKTEQDRSWEFCAGILTDVSRSFALIIPECPPPLDRALCVAYLLCRIADTVEDESALADRQRSRLFDCFLACVDEPGDQAGLDRFLQAWPDMSFEEPGYEQLVKGTDKVLAVFRELPEGLIGPIRRCVHEMVDGMRKVRPVERLNGVAFICRDLPDLDDYCHIVAGTVGIMSTALFEWRLGSKDFIATPAWPEQGRRLGLGLQMTNILKDCRVDADRGVSFIPAEFVDFTGGRYEPTASRRRELFTHAISHLDAGLEYTLAVPRDEGGIRRFLLGSLLPAIATLEVSARADQHHPRIERAKMMEILELVADPQAGDERIREWYGRHRQATFEIVGQV